MSGAVRLRVLEIRPETHDVSTYVFQPLQPAFHHFAGQSMTLRLPIGGDILHRSFSIASASHAATLSMTIKAHAQGRATRWMRDALKVGDEIEAYGPNGRFTLLQEPEGGLAFVSAGSGASPLMAMLRQIVAEQQGRDVAWLHWARTPEDILFAHEITEMQRHGHNLRVAMFVTRPLPGWFGFVGRPRRAILAAALADFGRRAVFCCGPYGFMESVRAVHGAEGGDFRRFHVEQFGASEDESSTEQKEETALFAGQMFSVRLGFKSFEARSGETLLAAATRQNVVIPCGCAAGICGTCRVQLVSGQVDLRHNGGLPQQDEESGVILACSSRPLTDLEIRF